MEETFKFRLHGHELDRLKSDSKSVGKSSGEYLRGFINGEIVPTVGGVVPTTPADGVDYGVIVGELEGKIKMLEKQLADRPKNEKLGKLADIVQASGGHVQTADKLNESGLLDKPKEEPLFPAPSKQPVMSIFKNPKVNRLVDRFMTLCPRLTDDGVKMVSETMTQWENFLNHSKVSNQQAAMHSII